MRGEPPDATYTFKHALVQEAAYASLLKRQRQKLHGGVVDVLLAGFAARAAAEPELVARHAEAAGRIGDAIACYHRAGEAAQAHSAHEESIRHFEHAIALLVTRPAQRKRDGCEAALQVALAESRAVALGYTSPQVEAAHERTRVLCEATGDTLGLGFALSRLAVFAHNCGQAERACTLAARALAIGEQVGDPELLLKAHCDLGLAEVYRGRYASSLGHLEAALRLHQPGVEHARLSATGNPGVRALSAQRLGPVLARLPRSRARPRPRGGDPGPRAPAPVQRRARAVLRDRHARAAPRRHGAARSRRRGDRAQRGAGLPVLARCRTDVPRRGEGGDRRAWRGVRPARRLRADRRHRQPRRRPGDDRPARRGLPRRGAARRGTRRGRGRTGRLRADGQPFFDAELHRLLGEIVLAGGGSPDEAADAFARALDVARAQEAKSFELRTAISLARLWHRQGRHEDARALLAPVHAWFSEGFDTRDAVAARRLLDELP